MNRKYLRPLALLPGVFLLASAMYWMGTGHGFWWSDPLTEGRGVALVFFHLFGLLAALPLAIIGLMGD